MFYKKVKDVLGAYVDNSGVRYDICAVRRIRIAAGSCCDMYEWFPALSAALLAWGLTAYPIDEPLTETEQP